MVKVHPVFGTSEKKSMMENSNKEQEVLVRCWFSCKFMIACLLHVLPVRGNLYTFQKLLHRENGPLLA